MSDSQVFVAFCLLCAVVGFLVRMDSFVAKSARRNKLRDGVPVSRLAVTNPQELADNRDRLLAMMSQAFGVRKESLRDEVDIRDELGIPPGELNAFLGAVHERFGMVVEPKEIRIVGDLLARIQLREENLD